MTRKQAISFLRTVQPQLIEAIAALSGNPADSDEFMPCDAYHVEYGKPRCWSTKDAEECYCGGNYHKCDFIRKGNTNE